MELEPDFSGYATKSGIKCSDGRIIHSDAFRNYDKAKLPLVWSHDHSDPNNVLGYAILEHRDDGTYAYGYFNDTENGKTAKKMVSHGDITALSIYANRLVQQGDVVKHGELKEVSLVIAGANPSAMIENVYLRHADGSDEELKNEAILYSGIQLEHSDLPTPDEEEKEEEAPEEVPAVVDEKPADAAPVDADPSPEVETPPVDADPTPETDEPTPVEHADKSTKEGPVADKTFQDVIDSMSEEQKNVLYYLVGDAKSGDVQHNDPEGNEMTRNAWDTSGNFIKEDGETLSHSDLQDLTKKSLNDMAKYGGSLKESFLAHAGDYGIDDIEFLFPDAKTLTNTPDFISRRMEWVDVVLSGVRHVPYARIKSVVADITADEARAKGYVKGDLKKDEVIKLLKRTTTPKTIYKKQRLDRDDIIDITELDVIVWIKAEMRLMLDEEVAGAILIGDGRESDDPDKIDEDHLRPIAFDVDMYNTTVALDTTPTAAELVDLTVRSRSEYKGSGNPILFTTENWLTDMILQKDTLGRRLYDTEVSLAAALRVSKIVPVEIIAERAPSVVGIIVNLSDYSVGTDRGGEISWFEDFDLDYNQEKRLIETRLSGALTRPKSAVTIVANPGTVVTPQTPTFVSGTGVVTIPSQTGVVYKNADSGAVLTAGAQTALASGATIEVEATPAATYSFPHGTDNDWEFRRP